MEQWEKNYYISSIAGAANGSSLVVMSKGWLINFNPYIDITHHTSSVISYCISYSYFY